MKYEWNAKYDLFCLRDRVDFVSLDHEVSLEGSAATEAVKSLTDAMSDVSNGLTVVEALQALDLAISTNANRFWQILLGEDLITAESRGGAQNQPLTFVDALRCLSEAFPVFPAKDDCCARLGFRFGGLYFFAVSEGQHSFEWTAKQIIEWSFAGKWLDRARPLFWQTGEKAIPGKGFLPRITIEWLQSTLKSLHDSASVNDVYQIDLRSFEVRRESLASSVLGVGILAPVISQENVTDEDNETGFNPAFSIVLSRYRQSGTWDGAYRCFAAGAHRNPQIARHISAAEAVERTVAASWQDNALEFGRLNDDSRRVDPRSLIDLDPEQLQSADLTPFDCRQPYYWCEAVDLINGGKVQVIADLCYFPFHPEGYKRRFGWGNSSGMAAGHTLIEAQRLALFELVERDAFMHSWVARYSPPHISSSYVSKEIKESQQALESMGYVTALLDMTIRGIPTVLGVAYRNAWPALVLGAASRNTLLEAMQAAWKEIEVGLYCRLRDPVNQAVAKPKLKAENVCDVDSHAKFFNHPDHLQYASFLWSSDNESSKSPTEPFFQNLVRSDLVSLCRQLDIDQMYMVDYGSLCGFQVIRLLTPQLVPLTFGYNQLPKRQVLKSSRPVICSGALPDSYPVHPFD